MLDITLDPERLTEGSPEEKAAFGLFAIRTPNGALTEGFDSFINSYRRGPLVSGYHVAQWFAWNWWRLRWEARSAAAGWDFAHRMTSIGEGYVWPNLTIFSDGVRTALIAEPSARPEAKPFRYVGALPLVVPSSEFEASVDTFIAQVLQRIENEGLRDTNLSRIWADVTAERSDPEIAKRRKLEAYLGRDPDEVDDDAVEQLLGDVKQLGAEAVDELAAHSAQRRYDPVKLAAATFTNIAQTCGYSASSRNLVKLNVPLGSARSAHIPAWRLGARVAQELRAQLKLEDGPISNDQLADMVGTKKDVIVDAASGAADLSFALDDKKHEAKIVLRSKWQTGRRFDLARLLGDRLMSSGGTLFPATRASTYRQKAQRAFAAELLSPFSVVEEMLHGDYSAESQQDVADHFSVSPLAIGTLLKNHGRMPRDAGDFDFDVVV